MSEVDYSEILTVIETACDELPGRLLDVRGKVRELVHLEADIAELKGQRSRLQADADAFEGACLKRKEQLDGDLKAVEKTSARAIAAHKANASRVQAETDAQVKMYRDEAAMWDKKRSEADLAHSRRSDQIKKEQAEMEHKLGDVRKQLSDLRKLVGQGG